MKTVLVIIELLIICFESIKTEPNWTYELLEMNAINKKPDIFNVTMTLERISRGLFGISGTIEIKQDITDETIFWATIFYSQTGNVYAKTPFHIPNMTLAKFINTFYKDLLLDSLKACTKNAPLIATEDPLVPPLTARVIEFNKCIISNENMPSILKPGFYKIVANFKNQVDTEFTIVGRAEAE